MEFVRETTCCFTGHRPKKLNISEQEVRALLNTAIDKAISDGFTTFISGMAPGVDTWSAEIILQKRENNHKIKLVCALPYETFQSRSSLVACIKQKADRVEIICDKSLQGCYQMRNKYMVDNSSRVICVFNGASGGTKNTIAYAKQKCVQVDNVI